MAVSHTFDVAGRETLLGNYSPSGTSLAVFTNTYDGVGNRLSVLELDGSRVTYAYDPSYQLTNEQRSGRTPYNTTFSYDGMGNRLVQNNTGVLTTSTFNAANELLTSQITVSAQFYQINCAGAAASPFSGDVYYASAGTMFTASTASAIDTSQVTNPAPQACYQSQRYMNNGDTNPMFYVLPNLTPGATYKVRLHWAGLAGGGAGLRFINVLVNGQPVISHFDVNAEAIRLYGGTTGDLKAVVREVSGIADGAGNIVLAFTSDPATPM